MANISKADLVRELTEKTGMGQKEVKTLVDGMLGSVTGYLKQGNKVQDIVTLTLSSAVEDRLLR